MYTLSSFYFINDSRAINNSGTYVRPLHRQPGPYALLTFINLAVYVINYHRLLDWTSFWRSLNVTNFKSRKKVFSFC
jgi:hypothetical protein